MEAPGELSQVHHLIVPLLKDGKDPLQEEIALLVPPFIAAATAMPLPPPVARRPFVVGNVLTALFAEHVHDFHKMIELDTFRKLG